MIKSILLIMGLLCLYVGAAQVEQQLGKVVDESNNSPLSGASIRLSNGQTLLTNDEGIFRFNCIDGLKIKVSYVGFETIEKDVACGEQTRITLSHSNNQFDVLEITATASPDKSQLEQAYSVVKLSKTDINRGLGLYLDDAINTNVPGVQMERRSQSGGQQLNIRGYGNGMGFKGVSNNFDSQGLKMYLNGIAITDAEGITIMDDIDFGTIASAEILKGPSGTLYGLAIAGVVNLKTASAKEGETSISQHFTGGSYGLFRSTSTISIGGKKSSLLVNYGHQLFDGYMPHTKSNKDFVNFIGNFDLNDRQSLTTFIAHSNSYDERNGELTKEQYSNFDYSGNPRYIANNAHSAITNFRAGVGHTYKFSKQLSNTTTLFGTARKIDQSSAGGWTDKTPLDYGFRSTFDMHFKVNKKVQLSGIIGLEAQRMNAQTTSYGMGADSTNLEGYNIITNLRSIQETMNSTLSYFTQWTLGLPKGFSINAGIGISNMNILLSDKLWANNNNTPGNTTPKSYHSSYSNLASPNVSVHKRIHKKMAIYTSYSVAYKAPVGANILIATTGELNTGLKPERGEQLEIGTKGQFLDDKLYYTFALFNTQFKNKFTTETVQNPENTATLYSYLINGGSLNNTGLELLARYVILKSNKKFMENLSVFANFTYSDFKYANFKYETIGKDKIGNDSLIIQDYTGNQVAGVSPVVFNAGLDAITKIGLYGNVTYNYKGAMNYTSDDLNRTDPYSLLNAKIGFKKSIQGLEFNLYGGLNNILSSQYYNMVFVNQLPDAYIPGPNEINFFGGLNLKYKF